MGIRNAYSVYGVYFDTSYTDGNEQQHRQFISLPATVMIKDRIQSCVWCLQKSRVPFSWSNPVFCILYRVTVASPIPCHAYADTIPILSPGEHRKHHDWCHAVSPSTCLGTLAKVYPFKHETRAFHENLLRTALGVQVQGRPNSILQVSTLFFIKKETRKQKDATRTGRQDVNVHLPSVFKSSIIWVLD